MPKNWVADRELSEQFFTSKSNGEFIVCLGQA